MKMLQQSPKFCVINIFYYLVLLGTYGLGLTRSQKANTLLAQYCNGVSYGMSTQSNAFFASLAVRERTVRLFKGTGDYPWGFRIQFSKPIVVTEVDTSECSHKKVEFIPEQPSQSYRNVPNNLYSHCPVKCVRAIEATFETA